MPVEVYTRRKTDMEILRETATVTRRTEEEEHGLGFNHPPVQRRKRPVRRKSKPQIDTSDLSTVLLVKHESGISICRFDALFVFLYYYSAHLDERGNEE
jgi:hypothetical protein